MPGKPLTRERARLDAERRDLAKLGFNPAAGPLPTERRAAPIAFTPELGDEAVLLGACGLSQAEVAAHWNIALGDLYAWRDQHPAFADALARGDTQALAWWEAKVRHALETGDNRFPVAVWITVMKARFPGYQERIEVHHRGDILSKLVLVDLRGASPAPAPLAAPADAMAPLLIIGGHNDD